MSLKSKIPSYGWPYQTVSELIEGETYLVRCKIYLTIEHLQQVEIYPDVTSEFDTKNQLNIEKLINYILNNGIYQKGHLYYWDLCDNLYVHLGNTENFWKGWISKEKIVHELTTHIIRLKFKKELDNQIQSPLAKTIKVPTTITRPSDGKDKAEKINDVQKTKLSGLDPNGANLNEPVQILENSKNARHRERSIAEAKDLVRKWRELKNGKYDPETNLVVTMKLDDAANKLGVPKKSLDDYKLYINHGKKQGFNFELYEHLGFGKLRKFVNDNKKKSMTTKK